MWVRKRSYPFLAGSNVLNRKQMAQFLVIISTGIFILAVLFSMVRGFGFYVSLGLLIAGSFSMVVGGILRETTKDAGLVGQKVALPETDDIYA